MKQDHIVFSKDWLGHWESLRIRSRMWNFKGLWKNKPRVFELESSPKTRAKMSWYYKEGKHIMLWTSDSSWWKRTPQLRTQIKKVYHIQHIFLNYFAEKKLKSQIFDKFILDFLINISNKFFKTFFYVNTTSFIQPVAVDKVQRQEICDLSYSQK